jgi:hypothetical protein
VWVEIVEIQIWFVFYKTDMKKKTNFLFEFGYWGESLVRPRRTPHARGLRGPDGRHCGPMDLRARTA